MLKMSAPAASIDITPSGAEQVVELLLVTSSPPPRRLHAALPDIVERLAKTIAVMRSSQEAPALTRLAFGTVMKELGRDLEHAAKLLEKLRSHVATMPYIEITVHGPRGVIDRIGGPEQIAKLRMGAEHARKWQKVVRSQGRHSLAAALGFPNGELITAAAFVRLRQLLRGGQWRDISDERQCEICERLWLLAGGAPSASRTRWLAHISRARGYKKGRAEAVMVASMVVDGTIERARGRLWPTEQKAEIYLINDF
jgi:hypothetical protein